jgi:hypothetical protein
MIVCSVALYRQLDIGDCNGSPTPFQLKITKLANLFWFWQVQRFEGRNVAAFTH